MGRLTPRRSHSALLSVGVRSRPSRLPIASRRSRIALAPRTRQASRRRRDDRLQAKGEARGRGPTTPRSAKAASRHYSRDADCVRCRGLRTATRGRESAPGSPRPGSYPTTGPASIALWTRAPPSDSRPWSPCPARPASDPSRRPRRAGPAWIRSCARLPGTDANTPVGAAATLLLRGSSGSVVARIGHGGAAPKKPS